MRCWPFCNKRKKKINKRQKKRIRGEDHAILHSEPSTDQRLSIYDQYDLSIIQSVTQTNEAEISQTNNWSQTVRSNIGIADSATRTVRSNVAITDGDTGTVLVRSNGGITDDDIGTVLIRSNGGITDDDIGTVLVRSNGGIADDDIGTVLVRSNGGITGDDIGTVLVRSNGGIADGDTGTVRSNGIDRTEHVETALLEHIAKLDEQYKVQSLPNECIESKTKSSEEKCADQPDVSPKPLLTNTTVFTYGHTRVQFLSSNGQFLLP